MAAERQGIAKLLRRFLNDAVEPWELDDFISSPSDDPIVETYRIEIARIPHLYPPSNNSHYASPEGLQRMQVISEELDRK